MTFLSQTRPPLWLNILLAALVFGMSFGAVAFRLDRAPDVFTDEILYTRAGIRVAAENALVWDNGEPLFVHPPLYFLVEGAFLALTADPSRDLLAPGDIFGWVYHARLLNALLAGATGVVLYLVGQRVRSVGLGLLLATLFFIDPFAVRINRRAMLETMAGLLALGGVALLLVEKGRYRPGRAVWAGLLLGAAMLTKELTFTSTAAVAVFGAWEWWRGRGRGRVSSAMRHALLATSVAGMTYLLFPLWALTTGRWARFADVKFLSLRRLLGLIQLSGWNRPELSLVDFLLHRLNDYGTTYFLLALGGLAACLLWLVRRHSPITRMLAVWGLLLYPFFAFVALVGAGNDQFFYFLLVPAIVLVGYTIAVFPEAAGQWLTRRAATRRWLKGRLGRRLWWGRNFILLELLVLLLVFNVARWSVVFALHPDNVYQQLRQYVATHLPPAAPLNATGDAIKFEYFFPHRPVTAAGTPEEARALGVHYFALAPKDVWARYGNTTPELATWIEETGTPLLALHGSSYGDVFLYRVDYPDPVAPEPLPPAERTYPPARAGFVGNLFPGLGLWLAACALLALWFDRRPLPVGRRPAKGVSLLRGEM